MKVQAQTSLRYITGIQSGPDAFDKSRFIMTSLTILGDTEILCSFSLVLLGKTGKEIPEFSRLEFVETFLANNSALSDAEDNTSGMVKRGGIADLPLLRTLLAVLQSRKTMQMNEAWNISQMIMKIIPISMRIVIGYAVKPGIPF